MRDRGCNIVLTGFMATGQTAVGTRLAARLEYLFADLDALIEAESGMSSSQCIAGRGGAAFREMESRWTVSFTR